VNPPRNNWTDSENIRLQKFKRGAGILLALPILVVVVIISIYFAVWRTDPLVRFTHMIWVLGFWMSGTVALFTFIIPVRLKISLPIPTLIVAIIFISLAIFFTPISRFTSAFPNQTILILPAVIGALNFITSWLIVLHFRKKVPPVYL